MGLVDIQSIEGNDVRIHARTADGVRGSILIYSDQNYGVGSGGTDATVPFFVFRRSFTGEGYFTETIPKVGRYVVILNDELVGLVDYQYFTIAGTGGGGDTGSVLKTYELRIKYYNLGWGTPSMLEAEARHILTTVSPILVAMGYTPKNQYKHDIENKVLILYFEGYSDPVTAGTILTLIAAVAAVLFAIGFVVTSMSWYQEQKSIAVLTQTKADILKKAAEDYRAGLITEETYDKIVGTMEKLDKLPGEDKPTDWGTIVFMLGGLAVAVYFLKDVIGGKK